MTTPLDRDTFKWLLRLLVVGAALIGLFSLFDFTPFFVRALGNALVVGGLLFLFDVQASGSFKRLYYILLIVWIVILVHSGLAFVLKEPKAVELFGTITFLLYALALATIPLFTAMIRVLIAIPDAASLRHRWKVLTRFSGIYYLIPFVAFLAVFLGRAVGADVELVPFQISQLAFPVSGVAVA